MKKIIKEKLKVKRERKELICEGCGATFKYKKAFLEHKVKAHGAPAQRKFFCSCCEFECLSWPSFMQHNATLKHKLLKAKYEERGETEKSSKEDKAPPKNLIKNHSNVIDENSRSSSEPSSSSSSVDENDEDVSKKKLKCSHCKKSFVKKFAFERHEAKCQEEFGKMRRGPYLKKPFKCDVISCQQKFHSKDALKIHSKLHGQFSCNFCKVIESYAVDLSLHEMTHAQKNSLDNFTCARCPYSCNTKFFYLDHHLEKHLGLSRKTAECPVCKAFFKDALKLEKHVELNHPKNENVSSQTQTHKCEKCFAVFKKDFQLAKHKRKIHPDLFNEKKEEDETEQENFKCVICEKGFPSKNLFHAHNKFEHGPSFACEVSSCSIRFSTQEDLDRHSKHHGNFPCTLCSKVETYAPNLSLHESSHVSGETGEELFFNCARCAFSTHLKANYLSHHLESHLNLECDTSSCPICTKKFYSMVIQRLHIKTHHNTEGMSPDSVSKCDQCPAYFRKYTQLHQHKKTIHSMKHPLTCSDCGTGCATNLSLRKHRIKKHGKKEADFKFLCKNSFPKCEEKFENKFQLDWHQRKDHDDEKNKLKEDFICAECGHVANSLNGLRHHMRKHANEKSGKRLLSKEMGRFVCEECGKRCKSEANLELHRLSHAGPESWKHECLFCEKKCLTEQKLLEHLRSHTKEKPYICEDCGEEYAHGHNLRNHRNKAHRVN